MTEPDAPTDLTKHDPPLAARKFHSDTDRQESDGTGLMLPVRAGAAPLLPSGTRLGRYEVREALGSGSFGIVYRAFDPELQREVAVKLPHEARIPGERLDAFLHEARAAATIHHQHICPVYDIGCENGRPFIVMHLVGGRTLAKVLDQRPEPLPAREAAEIVRKLALGVSAAHAQAVTHRDLKPANVLVSEAGSDVLITDFGLAILAEDTRASLDGHVKGTPAYMSPEQARGDIEAIGPASDVHALGIILYELATLSRPFHSTNITVLLEQVKNAVPRPPSDVWAGIDAVFDSICLKALAKRPQERFASARDFATALENYCQGKTTGFEGIAARARRPGEVVLFPIPGNGRSMAFCWIPPGTAQLGSPKREQDAVAEQLGRREVWFAGESQARRGLFTTQGFWLAKFPVTQEEWYAVMGTSPSHFQAGLGGAERVQGLETGNFPVDTVSWDMICGEGRFLEKLNALGNVEATFGTKGRFVLPHEDMWEYACRGGQGDLHPYYWGSELNGTQANCLGIVPFGTKTLGVDLGRTSQVGDYEAIFPHPWGLCDLHGNVWEWCENYYDEGKHRVLRGGSWNAPAIYCRASYRSRNSRGTRHINTGCRIAFSD